MQQQRQVEGAQILRNKKSLRFLAHQNRTIGIASDFRVDGAKSPEIPQKEGVSGSEIAARNRGSLATFHRTLNRNASLLSLVSEIAAISGVHDGHRNHKSQKSLRFRCAKLRCFGGAISNRSVSAFSQSQRLK